MQISFSALVKQHEALLPELMSSVEKVFRSGAFVLGKDVEIFEQRFADYHQRKYALGVNSGTDALILPLRALGIGLGDEVITTVNTFITTVSSIALVGAKPVLVDAADDDNIDILQIEKHITEKTKAILPVHWTGRPCQMDKIVELADKYHLKIIEDCAQAISARYNGQLVGTFGQVGSFSLHPFKTLNACGDAGIILTDDEKLMDAMIALRQNGLSKVGVCEHWSNNSRLDTLQAAVLNVKFNYFEDWTKKRIQIASAYDESLNGISELKLPRLPNSNVHSVFHTYIIHAQQRDELQQYLKNKGIETRIHYQVPIHKQPVAERTLGYAEGSFPQMDYISKHALSLPIYPELEDQELDYIVQTIRSFYCSAFSKA